ncbi:MAG TPA: hypothetical protein V6C84_16255 [Coleofasciculaceae cyanobacterium]|jgi:hypothetical protein
MVKLPECNRCQLYAHDPHLVCAVHPIGVEGNRCPDFEIDPLLEPEEVWQPEAASYYNGELIMQPKRYSTQLQRLDLLDLHPIFTGRCPSCEIPILQTHPHRVHWDCSTCNWKDDLL